MQTPPVQIAALILAGGEARRMGGVDKALVPLAGRPLLAHLLARLRPQIGAIALSANGDPLRFAEFGLPVVADSETGQGPLAGVLAGLDWALDQGYDALITAPVDTPLLPTDLVARLFAASENGRRPALAQTAPRGEIPARNHPTVALWPVALRPSVAAALAAGERRLRMALAGAVVVPFEAAHDPFANLNSPEDFAAAEAVLRAGQV